MSEQKSLHNLPAPTAEEIERARALNEDNFPQLHRYRTGTLAAQLDAQNVLLVQNYGLVRLFVCNNKWRVELEAGHGNRFSEEDLESVAAAAFMKTLTTFKYDRWRLSTCVMKGAGWQLNRWLDDTTLRQAMRLPVYVHQLLRKAKRLDNQLNQYGMDVATPELYEQVLGSSSKTAQRVFELRDTHTIRTMRIDSRDAEERGYDRFAFGPEHCTDEDSFWPHEVQSAEEVVGRVLEAEHVSEVMKSSFLSEREIVVIRARFGFDGSEKTFEQIGKEQGVTRERIRQVEIRALGKIRAQLDAHDRNEKWVTSPEGIRVHKAAEVKLRPSPRRAFEPVIVEQLAPLAEKIIQSVCVVSTLPRDILYNAWTTDTVLAARGVCVHLLYQMTPMKHKELAALFRRTRVRDIEWFLRVVPHKQRRAWEKEAARMVPLVLAEIQKEVT